MHAIHTNFLGYKNIFFYTTKLIDAIHIKVMSKAIRN